MIFKRLKILGVGLLLSVATQLWADCPLALTNAVVSPAPMEYKGVGSIEFYISEEDGSAIPPLDDFNESTCQFVADLNKIVPKDNNLSLITGEVNTYFNLTYDNVNNQVKFKQKVEIPADKAIKIVIPVDVVDQSPSMNPFNGFITNIHASSESIEQYTSTSKAVLLAVSDSNKSINGDTGGVAIKNITKNDTINNKEITLGGDVNITTVSNNTPLEVDKATGKVTVPAGTKRGTYTETYTICETYDTTNCAEANITVVVEGVINPPVITKINGDEANVSITTDSTPEINGTCEANLTVVIRIDGTEITPTTTCTAEGTFSLTPGNDIADGDHNVTAIQKDGNQTSEVSNVKQLTIDTTAPSKPTVVIVEDINNDGNISKANELNGTIDVNITVQDDAKVGDILTITHLNGKEENVTVTGNILANGYILNHKVIEDGTTITITAKLTDKAGNVSEKDSDTAILVDDIKPASPEITAMDNNTSNTVLTKDSTPEINGTCEANLTVTIQIDGGAISPTTTCNANGTFTLTPDNTIPDGEHNVTAIQVGKNGVVSDPSPVDTLIVDTTAPSKPTVVIVEDINNDGNISKANELNGTIDVNITLPSDAKVGDILTITNPDGNETNVTVTEVMLNQGVFEIAYAVIDDTENITITVKAKLTDQAGNVSEEGSDTATIINDLIPDYDIAILLDKTTVENVATPIEMIVTLSELQNGINSGDLVFSLTKNLNFTINFDTTLTTLGGKTLHNGEWEMLAETETSYDFKYIGNAGKYPSKSRMHIGLKGVFTPPINIRGKFIMQAIIRKGSGDTNAKNNKDSDTLIHSNYH